MVCLHVHSEYSNLRFVDSTNAVSKLIPKALEKGLSGICLTDHESLSGHIKMLQQAKKYRESNPDFKVMLGNEIYLIPEEAYKATDKFFHFILIAKDLKGHEQLRKLSSAAWDRAYSYKGQQRVPTFYSDFERIVGEDRGHLIASTACLGGFYGMAINNGYYEKVIPFIEWCQETFGKENFFIELQPGRTEEQIKVNKVSHGLYLEHGFNCIITNDVHYYHKEDAVIHAAYLNSKDDDREVASFYESTYFKSEDEIIALMEDYLPVEFIKMCIENTHTIADMCERYDLSAPTKVPRRSLPMFNIRGIFSKYSEYEYLKKFAESEYDQDRFLLHCIEEGFIEKGEEFNQENLARIDIELQQIWLISEKLNERLSSYYNLTQELVNIMWDDSKGNSLVGVARGSVTGFYICYLTSITQVNPIKWGLPWWRHIHSSRPELADVDLDSEAGKRKKIIEAIRQHYGAHRVLNIATFKTEGTKASLLTACRGLNVDNDIAQELSDMIPVERGKSWTLKDCLYGNEELDRQPLGNFIKKVQMIPKLIETALGIEGLVCGRSIHASGTYIYVNHYIEQSSLMRAPNGVPTTCWSMEDNDTTGALKMDLLTVEGLDKIRTALDFLLEDGKIEWKGSLRKTYDAYLHPSVLDYDSPEMWEALGKNKIIDVFQFDTDISVNCLQKIKPTNLKEMALANSLMRLSAYNGEMPMDKYARFKEVPELWDSEMNHFGIKDEEKEILKKYLGSMYGVAAEQEDIMELTMDPKIANFTVADANVLRKAIAKKKADVLAKAKGLFFEKGQQAGNRKEFLIYVWESSIMPQAG